MDIDFTPAYNAVNNGKVLLAMMLLQGSVRTFLEERGLGIGEVRDPECRSLLRAVVSHPSLPDESWSLFLPSLQQEELLGVIDRVDYCLSSLRSR